MCMNDVRRFVFILAHILASTRICALLVVSSQGFVPYTLHDSRWIVINIDNSSSFVLF